MDKKELGEIKTRNELALIVDHNDIEQLISEVERLTKENTMLERDLKMANLTIQKLSGENYQYNTSSFQAQKQEEKK